MNSFWKYNMKEGKNTKDFKKNMLRMYSNLYKTGVGLDMFAKGNNIRKLFCILKNFRNSK